MLSRCVSRLNPVTVVRPLGRGSPSPAPDPRLAWRYDAWDAGALVLDWTLGLDPATLAVGLVLERSVAGGGWQSLDAAAVALGVPESAGAAAGGGGPPTVVAVLPVAGWDRGATYRLRVGSALRDVLGRLLEGRFVASMEWWTPDGDSGTAQVVPLGTSLSGLFWFFRDQNWEVLLKMLGGCDVNGHHWVFAAATTNVGYRLRLRDQPSGEERIYENPAGTLSPAIIDTAAFGSCE